MAEIGKGTSWWFGRLPLSDKLKLAALLFFNPFAFVNVRAAYRAQQTSRMEIRATVNCLWLLVPAALLVMGLKNLGVEARVLDLIWTAALLLVVGMFFQVGIVTTLLLYLGIAAAAWLVPDKYLASHAGLSRNVGVVFAVLLLLQFLSDPGVVIREADRWIFRKGDVAAECPGELLTMTASCPGALQRLFGYYSGNLIFVESYTGKQFGCLAGVPGVFTVARIQAEFARAREKQSEAPVTG